jgi:hypothetical protein
MARVGLCDTASQRRRKMARVGLCVPPSSADHAMDPPGGARRVECVSVARATKAVIIGRV